MASSSVDPFATFLAKEFIDQGRSRKVIYYGGTPGSPFGRTGNGAGVETDLPDTDVPDDEDFLMEWDERSEIAKGFGPKATWTQDKGYNFNSGKAVIAARRSSHPNDVKQSNDDTGAITHSRVCSV